MILNLRRSLTFAIVAIALTFAYAYLGTGLAQVAFKSKADGSVTASGSTLIGQNWTSPDGGSTAALTMPGPMPPTPRRTLLVGTTPWRPTASPGSQAPAT